jgi:hypothetical protein
MINHEKGSHGCWLVFLTGNGNSAHVRERAAEAGLLGRRGATTSGPQGDGRGSLESEAEGMWAAREWRFAERGARARCCRSGLG